MVRVVPVVHRAPPPPPENPFQVPEAQPSSSSLPAQLAPSILQKHLRRNYITSHVPSGSPLHLSNHNSASKVASEAAIGQKQFSLFDYLQNLVCLASFPLISLYTALDNLLLPSVTVEVHFQARELTLLQFLTLCRRLLRQNLPTA